MLCIYSLQKLHIIPVGNQTGIPYTRVNHNKYMVTDKAAYLGKLENSHVVVDFSSLYRWTANQTKY